VRAIPRLCGQSPARLRASMDGRAHREGITTTGATTPQGHRDLGPPPQPFDSIGRFGEQHPFQSQRMRQSSDHSGGGVLLVLALLLGSVALFACSFTGLSRHWLGYLGLGEPDHE
jgi:hypothetical protein